MRQNQQALEQLNIQTKVVTFDADFMALAYIKETDLAWPLLLDTDQKLYNAYGLSPGTWWSIYNPGSVWKYLQLMFNGARPGRPGKDWRQLGGDVLIDPRGIVRMQHMSTDPHDRPAVERILELVKRLESR